MTRLRLTVQLHRYRSFRYQKADTDDRPVWGRGTSSEAAGDSIRVRRCAPRVGVSGEVAIDQIVIRALTRRERVALGPVDACFE
jgi:hypothetical protein